MSVVKHSATRRYRSVVRAERASTTRSAIIEKARALFTTQGYAATSVDQVAEAAGVSRRTVYDSVGGKQDLLLAQLELMAPHSAERFAADLSAAAGDGAVQLALAVDFVCDLYERGADVIEMARAAGSADTDLQGLYAAGERARLQSQRETIDDWARRGVLRPDLAPDSAADILWAMTSPAVYRLFITERRWPRQRFVTWLTEQLSRDLFG